MAFGSLPDDLLPKQRDTLRGQGQRPDRVVRLRCLFLAESNGLIDGKPFSVMVGQSKPRKFSCRLRQLLVKASP
ncbi:hypothetical protein HDF14_003096 [Edaphobacter lichenicola]|uniref:Uncharacterized protein n=1 Tax=Tunturiibacter gelidiferens TaxID=3069689 RepID=A0A9X0QFL1_9BACT|nr:hypothetical protein [Edaphobacter lichenicola]